MKGVYYRDVSISKDAARFPWIADCYRNGCYFIVSRSTEEDAEVALALHKCPMRGPTKIGLMMNKTLLEQAWEILDEQVAIIMDNDPDSDIEAAKEQARGIAKVLAIFMVPHFHEPHEISAEARRRYQARQSGDETYATAGLGSRSMEPPPGMDKYKSNTRIITPPASKHKFNEKEVAAIKFAAESGMFSEEDLAKTYSVTVSTIRAVLAESA